MLFEDFVNEVISTPFVEKGRDWKGLDCWGLVYLAYKEVLGVALPSYDGEYGSTKRRTEIQQLIARRLQDAWSPTESPAPLDMVYLRMLGRSCHVGLMIAKNGDFLHIEEGRGCMVENIRGPVWSGPGYNKVEGVYRHESRRQCA